MPSFACRCKDFDKEAEEVLQGSITLTKCLRCIDNCFISIFITVPALVLIGAQRSNVSEIKSNKICESLSIVAVN